MAEIVGQQFMDLGLLTRFILSYPCVPIFIWFRAWGIV